MEDRTRGNDWGGGVKPPAPKRKLIDLHDAAGLILFGIIAAPFVWMILRWILGM